MSILLLLILAIIQGLTEFLPVSSSGHLVFLENLLPMSAQKLTITAFLHLGTTLSLLFYFRKKISEIILGIFNRYGTEQQRINLHLILKIIIGTIPITILGLLLKDKIDLMFTRPVYVAIFLFITGILLFLTRFAKPTRTHISYSLALIIGCAQAIALLPGISRSGITIAIALLLGLNRTDSFEFSFLLSIPAVIGANILIFKDLTGNLNLINSIIAIITTFIIGLLALRLLKSVVIKNRLHYFAYYCWLIAIITTIIIGCS
ncbi:MAG: undecaprenyl-diphosphate phosphatase [candidate division WOR-3 bacterium]